MRINIETGDCRNEDVGDWWEDADGAIQIRIAPMPLHSAVAVAIHELVEILRCKQDGVTDMQVTQFDAQFVAEQHAGKHPLEAEAGNDPRSPYRQQHRDATLVERLFCSVMHLPWEKHEEAVGNAFMSGQK